MTELTKLTEFRLVCSEQFVLLQNRWRVRRAPLVWRQMKQPVRRMCWLALLCGICTFICYALYALQWKTLIRYEFWFKDMMLARPSGEIGPNPRLVFIGIDQPSYADLLAPE